MTELDMIKQITEVLGRIRFVTVSEAARISCPCAFG